MNELIQKLQNIIDTGAIVNCGTSDADIAEAIDLIKHQKKTLERNSRQIQRLKKKYLWEISILNERVEIQSRELAGLDYIREKNNWLGRLLKNQSKVALIQNDEIQRLSHEFERLKEENQKNKYQADLAKAYLDLRRNAGFAERLMFLFWGKNLHREENYD